jgi:hypothetical protein
MFEPGLVKSLSKPKNVENGSCILFEDAVFIMQGGKPVYSGQRQIVGRIVSGGMPGYAKVEVLSCAGVNPFPVGSKIEKPIANLLRGYDFDHQVQNGTLKLKSGGHLEGFSGSKKVTLDSADKGGMSVGARHSEGGIKGSVGTEGRPIEFEGKEIILTAPVADNPKTYEFEGKQLSGKEIASKINQDNGGVSFEKGGIPCACSK